MHDIYSKVKKKFQSTNNVGCIRINWLSEDPVKMFEHQSYPVQSQVKFMIDMFSHPGTASLLYVNDAKVLIDILIRNLTDLQPGDKVRLVLIGQSGERDETSH